MKPCPFCAEQIQDAAVVCRFCGRELGPLPSRGDQPGAALSRVLRGAEIALGVGAVALVTFLLLGTLDLIPRSARRGEAADAPREAPGPLVLPLIHSQELWLSAGEHFQTTFQVDDPRPCTLTGSVRGVAGGGRDVDVLLLSEEDYYAWRQGDPLDPLFRTRASTTDLDLPLPGRGRFALVVSNRFSVLTAKRVEVRDVRVTCG